MKKITAILLSVFILLSFTGCNRILGGVILEGMGMEFTSQIEMIEECLSVNLGDLTDHSIRYGYSFADPDVGELSIQYIDLEGAGEAVENDIVNNDRWLALPYDSEIENLLDPYGANEHLAGIKNGCFIISGVIYSEGEYDFDRNNFSEWCLYEIGIWDSDAETLYYISIIPKSEFVQEDLSQ